MIINKLEIENFMCYFGNVTFEFTEGLNVIIGDNGFGKSKLFDAFHWVLYNEIFVPEQKKFIKTYSKDLGPKLISDKAKYATLDDSVKSTVKITFHNTENDKIFIWEREYSIHKKNNEWIGDSDSIETIMQKDAPYLQSRIVNDDETVKRIKRNILPDDIKQYMWFQGEQVESMIDFNKEETLTDAINILSNISIFDEYIKTTEYLYSSANKEYDKIRKESSQQNNKTEELENEKIKLEEDINRINIENSIFANNLLKAQADCDDLINKIEEAEKVNILQVKKDELHNKLDDISESEKKANTGFHKKMFKEFWVLKNLKPFINEYENKYSAYSEKHYQIINEFKKKHENDSDLIKRLQTRLPFNVPEPFHLEKMLEHEKCLVCDREAKKDSEPWLKIKELIDRPQTVAKTKNEQPTKNNFEAEFSSLLRNTYGLSTYIDNVDDNITEALLIRNEYEGKRKRIKDELKKIDDEIQKILLDTSLKSTNQAKNILNEYRKKTEDIGKFKQKLEKNKTTIENKRYRISEIIEQLKGYLKKPIPEHLQEKVKILKNIMEIASTTRERVYRQLIEMLENEINIHYTEMTSNVNSYRGIVKLVKRSKENYMPQIYNSDGSQGSLLNTSNLLLIKLATIMSIITAKKSTRSTDLYTLISDAPLSTFGDDYILGFCKTVSKVYRQSIIMSKEFYKNETLRNELLANDEIKVGKVYMLNPSIKASERENQNSLSTEIKCLK